MQILQNKRKSIFNKQAEDISIVNEEILSRSQLSASPSRKSLKAEL